MDWIRRLQESVDYVESRLTGDIRPSDVAARANMSPFHFQRTFSVITGVTLAEYIRRRRLTLAAKELTEGADILATAVKYGYESQASFTRAYGNMHGITPGATRDTGAVVKAYPPLSFQLTIQGASSMDYEIRSMGKIELAGLQWPVTSRNGENFRVIPGYWEEVSGDGRMEGMMRRSDPHGELKGACVGACLDFDESQETFHYLIGMEPSVDADTADLVPRTIPALSWAIFRGEDPLPEGIQVLWKRIFAEWFPATEYTHVDGPELEIYRDKADGTGVEYEVWIPVEKG